ncbi:MAG: hypothetical protein AAGH76_00165 [Pseudomonadota bacterium]
MQHRQSETIYLLLLLIFSVNFLSACSAYRMQVPPRADTDGRRPVSVTVKLDTPSETYQETGFMIALENVNDLTIVDEPRPGSTDLVATLLPYNGKCFGEPLLTMLTLGVFPHVGCFSHGFRFELSGGDLTEPVIVDTRGSVTSVWGWAALLLLLSDDWVGDRGQTEYEARQIDAAIQSALSAASD